MFTLSVTEYTLCASLKSNIHVECLIWLSKKLCGAAVLQRILHTNNQSIVGK